MGSSKKHKDKDRERDKDHKRKRRHRSRSRSRSPSSRDHRHKRRKEREEGSSSSRNRDTSSRGGDVDPRLEEVVAEGIKQERDQASQGPGVETVAAMGGGGESLSLSIDETNKLRAKLGLKPLEVPGGSQGGDGEAKTTTKEDVHVPAVNLAEVKRTEKLQEKLKEMKDKRRITEKLRKVKTLGESDSEGEDASAWVAKSRKLDKDRLLAEKRAKLLEEMDEEFGVGDLVEEEFRPQVTKNYTAKDLRGLKVEHGLERFKEGQSVILTLKDKGVLDEEEEETLVNVNLVDDEIADKNQERKKKKPDYKPYDEPQYDEYGMLKAKEVLDKYDEEIHGEKRTAFHLGAGGSYNAEEEKQMEMIRQQLRQQGQALNSTAYNIASEYYTPEEMSVKFKKVKRKVRKVRKKEMLKADDLLPLAEDQSSADLGSRHGRGERPVIKEEQELEEMYAQHDQQMARIKQEPMDVDQAELEEPDILGPDEDLTGVAVEEDEAAKELEVALSRARKVVQKKPNFNPEKIAMQIKSEPVEEDEESRDSVVMPAPSGNIVLNSTSEFCRNLGEIPTYGLAGNRDENREELMDVELEQLELRRRQQEADEAASGWNEVDIDDKPVDILGEEKAVLEEEPVVNEGMSAALKLAVKKGYLEKEVIKAATAPKHSHLQAQNYSIEDKKYDDIDEKYRKRQDRYVGGGMITDFKEKSGYKPDVKLEYVDDTGRFLSAKEAFRQLSHRFHGKGSGKKKTEKRMKKLEEQQLMKQMSSTDTPLNTLAMLQEKQKSEKSPYIVLSGNKGMASSSISKPV